MEKNKTLGTLAALVSNIIFGFSFMFSKTALKVSHPLIILSVRFTAAFLFMSILAALRIIKLNYRGKNLLGLTFMALAQPFAYFILEIYGIKYTSSALSGIIISLISVAAVFLSFIFLKEKPTVIQIICSAVSLCGVVAISILGGNGGKNYLGGILCLILAVLCAAAFNLFSRKESKNFTAAERTYFMFLISFIGFNAVSFAVFRQNYIPSVLTALSHSEFVIAVVFLGIISSCITFLLYNYATGQISIIRSSTFANISTVVSVLAGIIILKEDMSVWQLVLCLPIIAGIFGVNMYGK